MPKRCCKATSAQTGEKIQEVRARAEQSLQQAKERLSSSRGRGAAPCARSCRRDRRVRAREPVAVGRHCRRRRPAASGCCWLVAEPVGSTDAHGSASRRRIDRSPRPGCSSRSAISPARSIAIAHTRLELLTTELQEEVRQVGAILLWAFIAAFAALLALFLGALAVIFVFWDTHRIAAVAGDGRRCSSRSRSVAGADARKKLRSKPPLLDDTLAELAKDRDQLQARLDEPALRSTQRASQQPAGAHAPCSAGTWPQTRGGDRARAGRRRIAASAAVRRVLRSPAC